MKTKPVPWHYDQDRHTHVLKSFDVSVERLLDKAKEEGVSVPCRRGCSACCSDIALTAQVEMPPIIDAIRAMTPEQQEGIRARTLAWCESLAKKTIDIFSDQPDIRRYHSEPRSVCPLLDPETKECMVYEVRPMTCRGHYVVGENADACADRANNPVVKIIDMTDMVQRAHLVLLSATIRSKLRSVIATWHVVMLPTWLVEVWGLVTKKDSPNYSEWLKRLDKNKGSTR